MSGTTGTLRHDHVVLPSGLRLHHVEQGDPSGPPVVLVHGWPDSWFSWSRVLPHVDPRLRVLAYDQRGFGDSDHPAAGYSLDQLADDLVALCEAVGLARASLVGHSMGSFVVRRVAERYPDRVDRLVLVDSADHTEGQAIAEVVAVLADLSDPVPEEFVREFQASTVHHPVPPEFFDRIVEESQKVPAHVYRDVFDALVRLDDRAELGRITAPTLLLWGECDGLFDRAQQDRLLAVLPDARLLVHADTGYCPNWERPVEVADQLNAFLLPA
jgi:pimeloyl-ACP methyl ester carboxylesterase